MRIVNYPVLKVLLFAVALGAGVRASHGADPRVWRDDPDAALNEGLARRRPVLLHFHAVWCGPCLAMEANVFPHPDISRRLSAGFVAVKIDTDKLPEWGLRYGINSLPSDVVLDPQTGQVIAATKGGKTVDAYRNFLDLAASRYRPPAEPPTDRQPSPMQPPASESPLARGGQERDGNGVNSGLSPEIDLKDLVLRPELGESRPMLGLEGFSPVALVRERRWTRGDPRYRWTHKGIVYQFANETEWKQFRESPETFAPRLLGCDPVILWETDRAIAGNIRHGGFYGDELFLFNSSETRKRFEANPERYTKLRHAVNPQSIERGVLR